MLLIKYGIIAVRGDEILHFCGYSKKPTQVDFDSLQEELETDRELGLVGQMKDVKLMEASRAVLELYAKELRDADPDVIQFSNEE